MGDRDSLAALVKQAKKEYAGLSSCVLGFSGGSDSSLVASILQKAGIELSTATLDFGQVADFRAIKAQALRYSKRHFFMDAKGDLTKNAYRGIKANCIAESYLQTTSFSTPVLAKALADLAKKHKIQAVAHGFSGMGNDQIRFENAMHAIAPEKIVLAPIRDLNIKRKKLVGSNESFWAREIKQVENPPAGAFRWVRPSGASHAVRIFFDNGVPNELHVLDRGRVQESVGRSALIPRLNVLAGSAGIGRFDIIVDKVIGLKQRELHEAPAAQVLVSAHKELETLVLTAHELQVKNNIDHTWNKLVYEGFWFSRLRLALDSFIDGLEHALDGSVTYELSNCGMRLVERESQHALYDRRLSGAGSFFDQKDARNFIKLYGLENTLAFRRSLD